MKEKTSLVFTGDIGFDRYMFGKWDDEELLSSEILEFLHSADHVITNVEGPIAEVEQNTTKDGVAQLLHTIDPNAIKVLRNMKADIWNICNNHIMDAKEYGIKRTLEFAKQENAQTIGAGMNIKEARKPVILDEADRMLDMGFIEDIEEIFGHANPDSRILLFSATMPPQILKIASQFMGDYEVIEEEKRPEEPLLTEQRYWVVRENEKIEALVRLIDISPDFYGLVFTQTKVDADSVCKQLDEKGYEVAALHGDIPQAQREKILYRFRNKKTRILVATDVAARGIDIEGLTHVVNYALPFDVPTYVHRIGRTGRAGAKGLAFTFVRPEERRKLGFMQKAVAKASKGQMKEGTVPAVKEVLSVKEKRVIAELKEKLLKQREIVSEYFDNIANPAKIPARIRCLFFSFWKYLIN